MREEYFGSTYLYCAHPWKLEEEEDVEEEEEEEEAEEKEEGVSFASKWKTRIRKGIVWVYNTYSNINDINEKVWNIGKKRYFSYSKWTIMKDRKGIVGV